MTTINTPPSHDLPPRDQVAPAHTWDLADLFTNFEAWTKAFAALPTEDDLRKTIQKKFRGKLDTSPQVLFDCFTYKDDLTRKLENLYVYAGLRNSEDVANTEANEASGRIEQKMSKLMAEFSFLEPEMLAMENLEQWAQQEPLKTYAYRIGEILRSKPHILSEKEETLMTLLSSPLKVFDDVHSKWNNVDLKFESAKNGRGEIFPVTNARYSTYLQSADRVLRQNVFEVYYKEILKWRHTIAANYFGCLSGASTMARIRGFAGVCEAELFGDQVTTENYDTFISGVQSNLHLLHKSMALRAQKLGIPKTAPFDRYVSLFKLEKEPHFTWEEGVDLVLNSLKPLGEEYCKIAREGLTTARWVDRAENAGKRSGAFSWGTYDSRPYMLQTWTGTLHDVFTLAHELGHSMHSFYSHRHQPYHTGHYTIFVAEVASTLNEALLAHYILENFPNTDLGKQTLSESIGSFEGTVLRQMLFAAFERDASKIVDSGETFTADTLDEMYLGLTKQWYGESSEYPTPTASEWMRIPHFYSPFYVYKYATSYCSSQILLTNLLADPAVGQKNIHTLLQSGGSAPSLELLKRAGVDFSKPGVFERAFEAYAQQIAQLGVSSD